MSLALELENWLAGGVKRIGEIEIQTADCNSRYLLSHVADAGLALLPDFGGLEFHQGPEMARELSTYAEDGSYRFTKGQVNLRRGWVMALADGRELLLALDQFYPAAAGVFRALQAGDLEVENLRDKLGRQTGMYRFARNISDPGAQALVREVCGPAHQCAKRILWRIDSHTPLEESEASQYNGVPHGPEDQAIPLLCREACNHFVAECRKAAKAESEAKSPII